MSSMTIRMPDADIQRLAAQLARLPNVDIVSPMRKAAKLLKDRWQEKLPLPGYPGDKSTERALRESMAYKVVEVGYKALVYAIVGADVGKGGAHSHLYEEGHELWIHGIDQGWRTTAFGAGEIAEQETYDQRREIIVGGVTANVDKELGTPRQLMLF